MITLSAKESKVLGVRVARGVLSNTWQPAELWQKIVDGAFDFVRIKLPSADEQVFAKLDELGMHYCIHSILVRNSTPIGPEHSQPAKSPRVSFELFDGTNEAMVKQLVKDSWGKRTAVNYHNPYFRQWVSYEQEMEGSAAYAAEFNYTIDPTMPNWLVKLGNEYIGFVLGKVSSEGFEGIMYSLLPEYRGQNYAEDIMVFLKKWCFEQGIPRFYNDVVFQNMPSLKSIVTESIVPVETYLNVTISSLLSVSTLGSKTIDPQGFNRYKELYGWIGAQQHHWSKDGCHLCAIKATFAQSLAIKPDKVHVTIPIDSDTERIVLITPLLSGRPLGIVYLTYCK